MGIMGTMWSCKVVLVKLLLLCFWILHNINGFVFLIFCRSDCGRQALLALGYFPEV